MEQNKLKDATLNKVRRYEEALTHDADLAWKAQNSAHGNLDDWPHREAFLHAYASGRIAQQFGTMAALAAGQARELKTWFSRGADTTQFNPDSRRNTYADIYNNRMGIEIASKVSEADLASSVYQAVTDGLAIANTDPHSDYRLPADPGAAYAKVAWQADRSAKRYYDDFGAAEPSTRRRQTGR